MGKTAFLFPIYVFDARISSIPLQQYYTKRQSSRFILSIIIQLISKSDDSYIKEMYIVHRKLR